MKNEMEWLLLFAVFCGASALCTRTDYENCVRVADPLIKEAHLVFPDNMRDIEMVCHTWNKFVDCIRRYTDKCFDDQQRRQFNKAIENPIQSVHRMCSQPHYQQEYLHYAPCIKSTITETSHCGHQYQLLVEQVEQGVAISKATLCCSHDKFKECVQRETKRLCDGGVTEGPAARFSNQVMEKALSFLQEQCFNYIPNSGDCGTLTTSADQVYDTISSELYPWSTNQENLGKEMPSSQTWLPSSSSSSSDSYLGSRTRPASYGRASSWSDDIQNTQRDTTPSWMSPTTTNKNYQTGSVNIFNNTQALSSESTSRDETAWYPAAGTSNINEVDEPNQQGLAKPKNGATVNTKHILSLTMVATVLVTFC